MKFLLLLPCLFLLGIVYAANQPHPPTTPSNIGRRGIVTNESAFAFTDFDSYERFFDIAQSKDVRVLAALDRMHADGTMIPMRTNEPVKVTDERSNTYDAFEVELASGRRVWLSPKVVQLDR